MIRHHLQHRDPFAGHERRRHFITPLVSAIAPVIGDTAASIAAPAIAGAGIGALGSAVTGGNMASGALLGGITGGALGAFTNPLSGALGISDAQAGALIGGGVGGIGALATHQNPLIGALAGGFGGYQYGSGLDTAALTGDSGNPIVPPAYVPEGGAAVPAGETSIGNGMTRDAAGNIFSADGTLMNGNGQNVGGPLAAQSAATAGQGAGGGGILDSMGGLGNTKLALAALAAFGAAGAKPQQNTAPIIGPNSPGTQTSTGLFNQGLSTAPVAGRTAVNPFASTSGYPGGMTPASGTTPGNYWNYGGPEQTYFTGNSLQNFGFAEGGGVLSHMAAGGEQQQHGEFSTANGEHYVQGSGDGQSDSVPARLADGEYVFDATTVARLGNGSNRKGAEKLNAIRKQIARDAGSDRVVQKKVRRDPMDYFDGGALGHARAA